MQKPIHTNTIGLENRLDQVTVITGLSGFTALIIIFVLTYVFSTIFGDALFPQSGYFSELSNALTFPIRLGFSAVLAYIFYIFATAYDIKSKFIILLIASLFVVLGLGKSIVESNVGDLYTTLLHLNPKTEQAIVVALVMALIFLSAKMILEISHYFLHKSTVRLGATFYVLFLLLVVFWAGSVYVSVHNLEELKAAERTIALPNTDKITTKIPADFEDVRQLKIKNSSTNVVYINEPHIDGEKQSDYLAIHIPGYGTKLKDFCGSSGTEAKTSNGIAFTIINEEKNSSIPPLPENAYQQTRLCFVVGQYGYKLSRNNAYGKTSYAKYAHEEIVSLFKR